MRAGITAGLLGFSRDYGLEDGKNLPLNNYFFTCSLILLILTG